jgi:hypothetical protein
MNEEHNHEVAQIFEGHEYIERLKSEVGGKGHIHEMPNNMTLPIIILSTLKKICRPSAFYIQNQQISIVIA